MSDECGSGERKQRHCRCISHEFFRVASKNPKKIAVIHASGGAHIARELFLGNSETDKLLKERAESLSPPVYQGDRCFTYSDILASVDFLSARLRSILLAAVADADDQTLSAHSSKGKNNYNDLPGHSHMVKSSASFMLRPAQSPELKNMYVPKIVGIYMPPSVEYIVAVLSVLRCGVAFMPLDPSWPSERLLSVAASSNVDVIIKYGSSFGMSSTYRLDRSHWPLNCGSCSVLCFSMEESIEGCVQPPNLVWPCEIGEERVFCYLMFTSGSTGKPKGVCGAEKGLINRFLWMQDIYPLQGVELLLFKTSISFVDHLQEFLGAILAACPLIIPPFNELKENIFSVVYFLRVYFISRLTSVPSLMRAVIPALQSHSNPGIANSLKLLVLSGEVLPLSLWDMLAKLLPDTSILNIYGSTEVSGDCTYFDCKRLPMILDMDTLASVPIGLPISNCDVLLLGESENDNEGELYVGGVCVSSGYYSDSTILSLDCANFPENSVGSSLTGHGSKLYFKTGDFARRLQSGDLVFLGRKDRTVKVNGQRIALEEIEDVLRRHPDVLDAAVLSSQGQWELVSLEAFIVLKEEGSSKIFRSSIRSWMVDKLPSVMLPNRFTLIESIPVSSTGKVDYELLGHLAFLAVNVQDKFGDTGNSDLLQVVKKAFSGALMVEEVSDDDDFFMMGGNSISAAQLSYNLGVDMQFIYHFPSPSKLYLALLEKERPFRLHVKKDATWEMTDDEGERNMFCPINFEAQDPGSLKPQRTFSRTSVRKNDSNAVVSKCLKVDSNICEEGAIPKDGYVWDSASKFMSCSATRCNKVMYDVGYSGSDIFQQTWSVKVPRDTKGSMHEIWKVHMESCVDASPIVVFKDWDIYLFIGSHSCKFLCVSAKRDILDSRNSLTHTDTRFLKWEIKLEGRIECSAAILGDFSQVVVGCYKGKIYFIDISDGRVCWTFQTSGEVKSQPVVDIRRQLIWCGSYDHYLYALDYKNHCCVYMLPCGGSIYGSPAIDEVRGSLYVASTSGRMTAISAKSLPFNILWLHEFKVPVFGSLAVNRLNGNVICCLVDGHVLALHSSGSILWKYRTGGPIFAGPCISAALPSQGLICSRNGGIYSLELVISTNYPITKEKGDLIWEYNIGDPITASAYVDEHLQFIPFPSPLSDRLICICSSSGSIRILRVIDREASQPGIIVEEFARLDLRGDVFSSPVMIGGRIFVGCRDDYMHCISVDIHGLLEN